MYAIEDATGHADGIHEVLIPEGYWFSLMPVSYEGMTNLTIRIDGEIRMSKRHSRYPVDYKRKSDKWKDMVANQFQFDWIENVLFTGTGTVDGQGYMWWMREYLQTNFAGRPHLVEINHG
jgi:hypothetical protein